MDFAVWRGESNKDLFLKAVRGIAKKYCLQKGIGVAPTYANRYAREEADFILVGTVDKVPLAFILAKHEPSSLYLAVVCGAQGTGRTIMDKFLAIADAMRLNVSLSAMPSVLSYYAKFDFAFRKSCDESAEIVDASSIAGKKPPMNLGDIAADPHFGPILVELQKRGFNVMKDGQCAKKRLSASAIIQHHCEDDGYTMFRCRVPPKRTSRKRAIDTSGFSESKGQGKRSRRSPTRLTY